MPFEDLPTLDTGRETAPGLETVEQTPTTESTDMGEVTQTPDEPSLEGLVPQEDTAKPDATESRPVLDPKIQGLIEKYGGDLSEVAKAALHAQQKMTESSQEKGALEREVEQLRNQVNSLQMSVPQQPQQGQQALSQEEVTRMNEDFWNNPVQNFQKLMDVRDQQRESQQAQQELHGFLQENQADVAKHQNRMNEIYTRNPNYFNSQAPNRAIKELLNTAKKEQSYEAAAQFIGQLQQMGYGKNVLPSQQATQRQNNQQLVGSGVPSNVVGQQDLRAQELYKRVIKSGGKDDWEVADLLSNMGVADHIK